ncbi:hypothetical protein ACH47Z_36065 [Streptomyces sp. NPDC020192]|uniref:hypothetical protein n=1 Tax=Streptomyces sp. NPDC020192 TaxID=3365066 RepID=UPI00379D8630
MSTGGDPGHAESKPVQSKPVDSRHADFMSALVTEHFVLQSAASTTVSEATGRASLYLSALSSSLVAMGFAAQSPHIFVPFMAIVLPALLITGVFTTVRLVDTGVQNLQYLAGIARIREYYRGLDPATARYFTQWGQTDGDESSEALASLALKRSPLVGLFTTASMIAAVNSLIAGASAVLAGVLITGRDHTAILIPLGLLLAALCMTAFCRYQDSRYRALERKE